MLTGVFIILFFYALGEFVAWLISGFIPGNVVGMMLLFTALCLKIVKPERIRPVVKFLSENMVLFFIPAGVGIVNAMDILSKHWQAILTVCALSTVLVIVTVAFIQQWLEKRKK
ncbi:CidA/LrgA family protein [Odoribacter lunatus]|uniref:CidA/LrgA family protein n=1 Tax=Odoribacter lunatus TaxID=2941335 RepID=UPI00203CCE61|nr:CidA/LrgA family protein [Odoribacter lunatus]